MPLMSERYVLGAGRAHCLLESVTVLTERRTGARYGDHMEVLRFAIENVRATDIGVMSDDELHAELESLEVASRAIESERTRRLAEADRRRSYAADGYLSLAAWLRGRLGVSGAVAAEQVRIARALESMPRARTALASGEISMSATSLLASAHRADPATFGRSEPMLVDLARRLSPADLRRAIEHWRQLADAEHDDADERRFDRRRLHMSPMLDGMIRVDGELDPEAGQTVMTALGSMLDAWSRGDAVDARTPAQRRADALAEICRRYLDSPERAAIAGERPHVTVTLDLDSLEGRAGRRCELDDAGTISAAAARRLACDAAISRVIVGPRSEPIDVGRRTPVVPAPLRRAVVVRDGACRFPGCDRPQSWCDAHHVVHWADGGETKLQNLMLLCRPHHRLVHGGFSVSRVDDGFVFRRRDGSILGERARAPNAA